MFTTFRPFQQVEDVATSPSARSCSWRGMFGFPSAQLFWNKNKNCGAITPKSLKILPESWATKLFWFLLSLASSRSFNSNRKVHICRNEQLVFLCYNSSPDLKSFYVINHAHFTALTRTGLKFFTVFCYQWSFRLSLKFIFYRKN